MKTFDFKAFRKINNLSQKEAATYFSISQPFVSQMESGQSPVPEQYINKVLQDNLYKLPDIIVCDGCQAGRVTQTNQHGDNINGGTVKVTKDGSDKLVEVIMKQADQLSVSQAQLSKSQEQIDRLITLIENRTK